MTLEERIAQLRDAEARFPGELSAIAKGATIRAVEKATELTPPTLDDLSGTNTRSGEMKQHWASDSKVIPVRRGDTYVTELNNDKQYASYVNDGHRMDRHFVPGLYINTGSGLLEYDADYAAGGGGIMVGTKTSYVPGLHMEEAAQEEYHRTVAAEAEKLRRLLE